MIKYVIALVIVVIAGGAFLYSTQTAQAPVTETHGETQNPFGDGANSVGSMEEESVAPPSSTTGGVVGGEDSTKNGNTDGATAGVISRVELARHNTQADCWIAYKGVVYDVTNWLPRHPGSAGAIAPFCGTADEFAAAFNRKHGTSKEGKLEKEGVKEGTLSN